MLYFTHAHRKGAALHIQALGQLFVPLCKQFASRATQQRADPIQGMSAALAQIRDWIEI